MRFSHETIAAQATASGRGGIAIIRVSGPNVEYIISQLLKCKLIPREATYLSFYDENGDVLDQGVAIFFPHPHSFTGEDVLELHGHGSPIIVDLLLNRIIQLGARLARPGEFSLRAFLNDKMDLAQAEAVADLINASSREAARSATRSLQGEFSREIQRLNEKIIHLRMYIEAAIDFTDEEIDFLSNEHILSSLNLIINDLIILQEKSRQGSLLREGITAVIVGKPNVGKSSLLNRLSGKDVAIVTDIPGTTRDVLRDQIHIDGMPIHVIDTAGLRISEDIVEQEGIKRAYQEIEKADIILYMVEANRGASQSVCIPQELNHVSQPILVVRNKIDLTHEKETVVTINNNTIVSLSVKKEIGLDLLKNQIKLIVGFNSSSEGVYLARTRHLEALSKSKKHLEASLHQLNSKDYPELAAEDLRQAHLALCEITGTFTTEDLLGKIFSNFCIGK